ncbi:MAG: DUF1415 domain-containing protein [Burkholderiales bacterium]|nr:DUF1415 domain-containing protein [Burkholderiales bacterium]
MSDSTPAHLPARPDPTDRHPALAQTRAWVARAVVGLNLCPFAKAPWVKGQIRFVLCEASDPQVLLDTLCAQMHALAQGDPEQLETTLVVHPNVLGDFGEFNDFLDRAEAAVDDLGYAGVLQVASFHPHYQFAGTAANDLGNATNRSPFPTLHLLREASVERAVAAIPQAASIYETNVRTLQALGPKGWAQLQAQCRRDALHPGEPD